MAHSLYRKYRPETFDDVIGQEHIETTLCNAVEQGSVSHAYLFCGPRGTGKTTTARLLAKALLCDQAPTGHPDGSCPACRDIADGLHPDVYELDAASRTGVENVREEIIGRVQFAPTRGSHKIYIIDEVHMLSQAAFNALLKTLEEPPSHVLFVLCTTDPHKVPETIQSRCQRFDFHRLSEDEICARLAWISEQEGYTVEPEALSLIARRSQGGMRDAIGSLEQVAVFAGGDVSFEAAENMLGEVAIEQLFSVGELIAARDIAGCFAWVASFAQSGTDTAQFVRDLSAHVRNLYVAAVLGDTPALAELLDAEGERCARYLAQAQLFGEASTTGSAAGTPGQEPGSAAGSPGATAAIAASRRASDRLANDLVVLGDLSAQLRSAANARLALEIALTRMARPDSDLSLESLAARLAVLESRIDAVAAYAQPGVRQEDGGTQGDGSLVSPKRDTREPSPCVPSAAQAASSLSQAASVPSETGAADAVAGAAAPVSVQSEATEPSPLTETSPHITAAPLTLDSARHLWQQVEKELTKAKRFSVATSLGGSSAHLDPRTGGLLIELPSDASFAKQNLERPENRALLDSLIVQLNGAPLPLSFNLGAPANRTVARSDRQPSPAPAQHPQTPSPSPTDQLGAGGDRHARQEDVSPARQSDVSPVSSHNETTETSPCLTLTETSPPITPAPPANPPDSDPATLSFEGILSTSFGTGVAVDEVPPQ